jgi:hypothetical protein
MICNFYPTTQNKDIIMTSNVSDLLTKENHNALMQITAEILSNTFGERQALQDSGSGYDQPEWYFRTTRNQVVGVGFRYGKPRLRGKHLPRHIANLFIEQLSEQLAFDQTHAK